MACIYISLLRQHSIMSIRLFHLNQIWHVHIGMVWSASSWSATGSHSFELNLSDSAPATQLTRIQNTRATTINTWKCLQTFPSFWLAKVFRCNKNPPLFITEDRHNVSILQQDFILYLLWYMQPQEQINQKFSDLIGKKQIGSCQNLGIYVLLSHITLCTSEACSKLERNSR